MDNERPMDDERPRQTIEADLGGEDDLSGFGWRKLLATALAFATLGYLALFFLAPQDQQMFFLIMAGVTALALILSRIRARWAGLIGLLAILGVGFFTFWVVFSLFVPASLFEFSSALLWALGILFGLIAAIATLVKPRGSSTGARVLAFLMIILLVAGLGYSVFSFSQIEEAVAEEGDLEIEMVDFEFEPNEAEVEEGQVAVHVTNIDNFTHSFTIDELDVDLFVEGGVSKRTTFAADSGEYEWYCVPHPDMKGTLTVE
jgi:plastocyanin